MKKVKNSNTENTEKSKREKTGEFGFSLFNSCISISLWFSCFLRVLCVLCVKPSAFASERRYFAGCSMSFCARQFSNSPT